METIERHIAVDEGITRQAEARVDHQNDGDESPTFSGPRTKTFTRITPVGAMVILLSTFVTSRSWADYDLYWHLAEGRLMVRDGGSPSPDHLSWSMNGHRFVDLSLQADRLLYLVWSGGGARALGFFAILTIGLALLPFAVMTARLRARPFAELVALFIMMMAVLPFRGAHPQSLAWMIFGLVVFLLDAPMKWWKAIACGLMLGLWSQLHGSFPIGFAFVAVCVASWLYVGEFRSAAVTTVSLIVGFLMSLMTPYGLSLWSHPFESLANRTASFNMDWSSLRPLGPGTWPMGVLLLLSVAVGIWRVSRPRSIAAAGLALSSIQLVRFVPFAAPLLGVLILQRLVERFPRLRSRPTQVDDVRSKVLGFAPLILLIVSAPIFAAFSPSALERADFFRLPKQAVDALLECGSPAPVWNDYNWGGYLLWRGDGQYTVFIDGRAETLYSNAVIDQYIHTFMRQDGWEASIQDSPAQYALLPKGPLKSSTLPAGLMALAPARPDSLPGWHAVFEDNKVILSARDGAEWRCPVIVQSTSANGNNP